MKKFFMFFYVFAIVATSFSQSANLESYNPAGKYHNAGLDYVLSRVKKEDLKKFIKEGNTINEVELLNYLIPLCNEFSKNNPVHILGKEYQVNQIKSAEEFLSLNNTKNPYFECSKIQNKEEALNCINSLITNSKANDEKLLVSGNIYLSSIEYWTSYDNKHGLFNDNNTSKTKINWWGAGYADVSGAYGGALLGVGGAIGFGLLGSANNLMWQCIFSLF